MEKTVWFSAVELEARWGGKFKARTIEDWRLRPKPTGPKFHSFPGRVLYKLEDIEDFESKIEWGGKYLNIKGGI